MKARNCPFCGTESTPLWADEMDMEWRKVKRRELATTGEITLCAGLGAIAEPYILAFTRAHHLSLGEIGTSEWRDFFDALDLCLDSGLFPSGGLSIFEHGGSNPDNSTGCLEHCHVHIIDGVYDLRTEFSVIYPEGQNVRVTEAGNLPRTASYLFTGIYDGRRSIDGKLAQVSSCGSQFFRRMLAARMGRRDWNWRLSPNPAAASKACRDWSTRFNGTQARVPSSET